ncbi:MAG: hypothetical protein PHX24_06455, partial [Acidithiobacillus sp.]|nr:hypothetical protein [Acidithiobacillus sp.]
HPPIPLHAVTSFQDFFDFYTQFDFHLDIVCYFSGFSKAMGIVAPKWLQAKRSPQKLLCKMRIQRTTLKTTHSKL